VKTFYSLEDIESLVAQGVRELIVDEDAVLTDVARDAATRMGLKLLPKDRGLTASTGPSPVVAAASGAGEVLAQSRGAKPRGCQHAPSEGHGQAVAAQSSKAARAANPSGGLVDDLVGAVRQMASKASAG
jgi:hypothetical protein